METLQRDLSMLRCEGNMAKRKNSTKDNTFLSPREREVMEFLKSGHRNRTIAKLLDLSEKSIGTYIHRIYVKFDIDKNKNIHYLITELVRQEKL